MYNAEGKCSGVKVQDVVAPTKVVIGDPSYFSDKVRKEGKVVRAIALLNHPLAGTDNAPSCQIIFPAAQVKRKNDLYLFCCSASHKVAPEGKCAAGLPVSLNHAGALDHWPSATGGH